MAHDMIDTTDAPPEPDGTPAALLPIKAVPGARRDQIAGELGGRLKVRVSAPPEGGRANKAICALIARELGLRAAAVTLHSGRSSPEKVLRVIGLDARMLRDRWAR